MTDRKTERKIISTNRKAHHDYTLEDSYEAGIVLMGSEIKSIRERGANLQDSFVVERNGEMWLLGVHISAYDQAGIFGHEPRRERKLLLHKKEISRILSRMRERGYSVIPTKLYFKGGRAKVEIALAKGKKEYDKRHDLAEKDSRREIQRVLKGRDQD
jgi:SsrA-binding protein